MSLTQGDIAHDTDNESMTEKAFSESFQRLLAFAKSPYPSMELMGELGVLFGIYKKLKKKYQQESADGKKRKK